MHHASTDAGGSPLSLEGSVLDAPGAVVDAQERSSTGTTVGAESRQDVNERTTFDVDQLVGALDNLDGDMPVHLEVLGDVIDIEGVVIDEDGVYIIGAEVDGP